MSEGKEIKFKFVVDEQSAQRVNRVLDEMIKRAQDLAKTLQGVGGVGGGGTGLLGKGTVGGGVGRASPQSTMASAASSTTQKVSFASVLGQNVDMLKKMGAEGTMAMKAMSDALATGVTKQKSSIGALEGELSKLLKMYQGVGVQGGEAFSKRIQDRIAETTAKLGAARKELSELQKAQGQADAAMAPNAEPSKLGRFARLRGFLNQGGGIGAQEVSAAGISRIPGIGGMLGGVGGLAGGAMFAGAGAAASFGVAAARQAAMSAYNAPALAQAARLQTTELGPSTYAMKMRAGDWSDRRMLGAIQNDPSRAQEFKDLTGGTAGDWNWSYDGVTRGIVNWGRRAGIRFSGAGDAWSREGLKGAVASFFAGDESVDYQNQIKQRNQQYIEKTSQELALHNTIMGEATQGSLGKMSMMRALGIGSGNEKKTGAYGSWGEKFLNQFGTFAPEEVVAAVQGIGAAGTRKAGHSGILSSVLSATGAGITSAATLGGTFSRQGVGRGQEVVDLLRTISGSGAQGGTDVSTASLIGSYMAQQADRLNIGQFGGQGAMGALAFGTKGPEGAMVARQNIQGMERLQELYAGSRDPAQAAMNFSLARKSAPDAGYYAQNYLATKLDANRIADALGPGKFTLTDEEKNLGLTPAMIRKQARLVRDSQMFRVMESGFAEGSDPRKMLRALKGGENLQQYALKNFAGEDGKWSDDERKRAIGTLATIRRAGDARLSESAAEGQARLELFGLGRRIRRGAKGELASDVAGGGVEAENARQEAKMREIDREYRDARVDQTRSEISGKADAYKRSVMNAENLAITAAGTITIVAPSVNVKSATGGGASTPNTRVTPKE